MIKNSSAAIDVSTVRPAVPHSPAHLDAWSKSYEGWLTPQRLSGTQGIAQAETNATAMQLRDNPGGVDWTFTDFCGDC